MFYVFLEFIAMLIGLSALFIILVQCYRHTQLAQFFRRKNVYIALTLLFISFFVGLLANKTYPPNFAMPAFLHSHAPGGLAASIPFTKIIEFFRFYKRFEHVSNIGADPNAVPSEPSKPDTDGVIRLHLTAKEVVADIASGISFNYWTYNGHVPGPMFRVREGDTVELTLTNDSSSLHAHNIDLHAVTGPGGGAVLTNVEPGQSKTFRWKSLNPGLFIYHCAMPNVSTHNSHGQYGLILVEPKEGLSKVDKEFYLVQGELYTLDQLGKKGLIPFDAEALLDGKPTYVTFNGKIESSPRMRAKVGDRIRIYAGNGGVNLISSFHVIGEIFDTVYPNASIGGALEHNTQAAQILPGGASIIEFTVDVPGKYLIVDHALARMNKGAWAVLEVNGNENPDVINSLKNETNIPPKTHNDNESSHL